MHIDLNSPNAVVAVVTIKVVQHIEVTILALRNESVEFKVVNTYFVVAKVKDLVVAIGEVGGHGATSLIKNTVFRTARMVGPCGPRHTIGLSDLSASDAIVEIIAHLCKSIAKSKGNHRNE